MRNRKNDGSLWCFSVSNGGGCIMQVQGAGCRVGKMQVCVCRGLFWPCTLPISNLQPAQYIPAGAGCRLNFW